MYAMDADVTEVIPWSAELLNLVEWAEFLTELGEVNTYLNA